MKAKLDANGIITISSESEVESYALIKWVDDNTYTGMRIDATYKDKTVEVME